MTMRVVIVTTLFVCAFGIELLLRPDEPLRPLFLLAGVAYGMALVYVVLDRWLRGTTTLLAIQLVGDTLMITLFVQITGAAYSPMSFLYLLPVGVASVLLFRRGGLAIAAACAVAYATMILLGERWVPLGSLVPIVGKPETGRLIYLFVSHLAAMSVVAWLSAYLSERLRAQGDELAKRQRALARLKALNENIIESINSGLITTDLDGRVHFINRGGQQITAYGQQEIEGRDVCEFLGLESGFLDEIRSQLTDRRRFRFERYFRTKDGQQIYLGIATSNLQDRSGQPLGFILIFQDLTEIQALEQEVRLKERMAALGEMAAGMAHELRNPLAAMSGAVQYLKSSLQPQGETLELMDIILRESIRLDGAIRDFLTFAKPGRFTPERVDLVRVLEDGAKLLSKSSELRPTHAIRTEFEGAPIEIHADANRLKQVFWNLATNALKAMPDGGELTIRARRQGDEIVVEFSDQGVGMDSQQRERYFQPFSSSFAEGTGLGAAIVYRLVAEHRGRIQLDSEPGQGTCVRVILPHGETIEQDAGPGRNEPLRAAGG